MATINSVLGPLETADLGFTLTHEHIFTASAGILQTYPELFGDFERLADEAHARWIGLSAKGAEKELFPAMADIPLDAPHGDVEVAPAIGDPERAHVHKA
jgi:phosphotriesterase-related protein